MGEALSETVVEPTGLRGRMSYKWPKVLKAKKLSSSVSRKLSEIEPWLLNVNRKSSVVVGIYATVNFTDAFRNVSVTIMCR